MLRFAVLRVGLLGDHRSGEAFIPLRLDLADPLVAVPLEFASQIGHNIGGMAVPRVQSSQPIAPAS